MLARFNVYIDLFQNHQWLFDEVVHQLEKDLNYPELFEDPSSFSNLEEILALTQRYFKDCIEFEPDHFYSILYKVDLSEVRLHQAMTSGEFETLDEVAAILVLERVVQKVVNRNRYSGRLN